MRTKLFLFAALVLCVGIGVLRCQSPDPPYKPIRLPGGRAFPAPQSELIRMRDRENVHRMRAHAWDLFEGLVDGGPVWGGWYTKCDVRLEKCIPAGAETVEMSKVLRSLEVPLQSLQALAITPENAALDSKDALQLDRGSEVLKKVVSDFRDHPQFASVLFNKEAADHILGDCLYPRATPGFEKTCPSLPVAPGSITPFDRGSIALKTVWARMVVDDKSLGHLWVWDSAVWDQIQKANDDPGRYLAPSVQVAVTSQAACENRDYRDDESVPISCFYAFKLTQADIDALTAPPGNLSIIDNSSVAPGNYLVLVGLHITTKEIPDWFWATFWWTKRGRSDSRAADRPKQIPAQWNHFVMETTSSETTPREKDGGPKICFNPFLETLIKNGAISNCMQCHGKAAFGSRANIGAYDLGILGRDGRTLASGSDGVQTDFIWSVANGQNPNTQKLLLLFEQELHELQLQDLKIKKPDGAPTPKLN